MNTIKLGAPDADGNVDIDIDGSVNYAYFTLTLDELERAVALLRQKYSVWKSVNDTELQDDRPCNDR